MIFNSWTFIFFLLLFLPAYYLLSSAARLYLLILGGLVFYGWWDERFLLLLSASTGFNFLMGLWIGASPSGASRKRRLVLGVAVNLAMLGIFKYARFLIEVFGLRLNTPEIPLPVGISFYTFQAIAYLVDIVRGDFTPTRSLSRFFLYKCFFPQLVAGPIERPAQLLPQFSRLSRPSIKQVQDGVWLIAWGYFLKTVVADNLALIVNQAFSRHDYEGMTGFHVATAVVAFSFQIYGDFAGYSKIARGVGKLLGIELMENFNHPYLARDPSEFWKRWHISLSSWLRDYLYIPLGGNRGGVLRTSVNLMVTMLLGGLWHGASLLFVLWGAYHGLLLVLFRSFPGFFRSRVVLFVLVSLGWMIFRAESFSQLVHFAKLLVSPWEIPELTLAGEYPANLAGIHLFWIAIFGGTVLAVDLAEERKGTPILFSMGARPMAWVALAGLLAAIVVFGASSESFIYFQF